MFEGRLGGLVIATASLSQVNAIDFQQIRQGNKNNLQTMEQSKIQFGVFDPIDLIQVKVTPPIFKGMIGDSQVLLSKYQRNFQEDLAQLNLLSAVDIQNILKKAQIVACQYGDNTNHLQIKKNNEEIILNAKVTNETNLTSPMGNLVNSASTASSNQFE